MKFHAKDLRIGRFSSPGMIYLVTTVTKDREKYFLDFMQARLLINCLQEAQLRKFAQTIGFVVMPDHLHWVFSLGQEKELSQIIAYIKGLSTYKIRRHTTNNGFSWQKGFHDHAFRNYENINSAMRYVIANPLRAGLVEKIGDYPHWDCIYL